MILRACVRTVKFVLFLEMKQIVRTQASNFIYLFIECLLIVTMAEIKAAQVLWVQHRGS